MVKYCHQNQKMYPNYPYSQTSMLYSHEKFKLHAIIYLKNKIIYIVSGQSLLLLPTQKLFVRSFIYLFSVYFFPILLYESVSNDNNSSNSSKLHT